MRGHSPSSGHRAFRRRRSLPGSTGDTTSPFEPHLPAECLPAPISDLPRMARGPEMRGASARPCFAALPRSVTAWRYLSATTSAA